jgi:hypothetical protein
MVGAALLAEVIPDFHAFARSAVLNFGQGQHRAQAVIPAFVAGFIHFNYADADIKCKNWHIKQKRKNTQTKIIT